MARVVASPSPPRNSPIPYLGRREERRERTFWVVQVLGAVLAGVGLLAWPLGLWNAAFERWAWFPPVAWSLAASLLITFALWLISWGRRVAAATTLVAAAVLGLPAELIIVDDGFLSLPARPPGATPAVAADWGHATTVAVPTVIFVSVTALLLALDRAPRLRSAMITASFVGGLALLAAWIYQVGAPAVPFGSVIGPLAGTLMVLAAIAMGALQPDLPPLSWLATTFSVVVFSLIGANVLLVPALLHLVEEALTRAGVAPADNIAMVAVIGVVLIEAFFAAQLMESRARWNRVVAVAAEGVLVVDAEGRISDANSEAAQLFGRRAGDLRGSYVWELAPPRLRSRAAESWRDFLANPGPTDLGPSGIFGMRADGSEFPLTLSLRPVRDYGALVVVVGLRDATEAVALQRENEEIRALLADTTDQSIIGSMLVEGPEGRLLRANDSLAKMLGYERPEDLIGRTMVDLCHPDDVERTLVEMLPVALGDKPAGDVEHRLVRKDGSTAWGHVLARALESASGRTVVSVQVVDISERVLAEQLAESALADLEHRSRHDDLTGLLNRSSITPEIDRLLARRRGPGDDVAVLFCDLDNFKFVNDEYSHEVGDQLLVQLARRIRETMRPTDLVARIAGDEFVIVLPDAPDTASAAGAANRLLTAISQAPFDAGVGPVSVSMSAGIALSSETATPESLLRAADIALHAAKESGRSQYRVYDAELQSDADERLRIAQGLSDALADDAIGAWFQPVVSMADGQVVGYEALARWHSGADDHAAQGWISVADEAGLLGPVGERVLGQAIRALAALPDDLWVAVNVAGSQITPAVAADWLTELAAAGVRPGRLMVEMREQSLLRAPAASLGGLAMLRNAGVGVFFDDFGTASSSVAALGRMPISGVKLDREFTATLRSDGAEARLAGALAGLAKELDLTTIAEGVETAEQRDVLLRAGWDLGQGWLFGHAGPLPLAEPALPRERIIR